MTILDGWRKSYSCSSHAALILRTAVPWACTSACGERWIGVQGLVEREKRHREVRRRKLLNDAQPYSPEAQPHILPGLGPHSEAQVNSQTTTHDRRPERLCCDQGDRSRMRILARRWEDC
jgi:hypothetical protein